MASAKSAKDKQMASYLRERGIKRTTAACPLGCGFQYSIKGGFGPVHHLGQCKGGGARRLAGKKKGVTG